MLLCSLGWKEIAVNEFDLGAMRRKGFDFLDDDDDDDENEIGCRQTGIHIDGSISLKLNKKHKETSIPLEQQ